MSTEQVVLLSAAGEPVGVTDKAGVHGSDTPLHLAFSCYLRDDEGRVLMTRRALSKATWPGVWSNSCCGHPAPGEASADAVHRRVRQELGLSVSSLDVALPDFRYRAVDASGVVENEVCPVFAGRALGPVQADPTEVAEHTWAPWEHVVSLAATAPWALSPWAVLQVGALAGAGWRP
jgi:isopentenyl-diphosphate delta-isomerase